MNSCSGRQNHRRTYPWIRNVLVFMCHRIKNLNIHSDSLALAPVDDCEPGNETVARGRCWPLFPVQAIPSEEFTRLNASREDNLWQGLRQLGYVEGKNVTLEYRYADGQLDRLPSLPRTSSGSKLMSSLYPALGQR